MAIDLIRYGSQDPIYFKLTLAGVGVTPTLNANDYKISKDGAAFVNASTIGAIASIGNGVHKWTPNASATNCKVLIFNIKDDSAGGAFDENCLIITTGGSGSAGLNGT